MVTRMLGGFLFVKGSCPSTRSTRATTMTSLEEIVRTLGSVTLTVAYAPTVAKTMPSAMLAMAARSRLVEWDEKSVRAVMSGLAHPHLQSAEVRARTP